MHGIFVNKSPNLEFEINGKKIVGIVDTGFNGYLVIPYALAFPLGLVLAGTETSNLADGSTVTSLLCLGKVKICGIETVSPVSVQSGNSVLIGTQLLEKAGKNMEVDFVGGTIKFLERPKPAPATTKPKSPLIYCSLCLLDQPLIFASPLQSCAVPTL